MTELVSELVSDKGDRTLVRQKQDHLRMNNSTGSSNHLMSTGLHKLWYPGIRDTSTWSKFGTHGEHGDVFLFSNLGAL